MSINQWMRNRSTIQCITLGVTIGCIIYVIITVVLITALAYHHYL